VIHIILEEQAKDWVTCVDINRLEEERMKELQVLKMIKWHGWASYGDGYWTSVRRE
jgi:hypothetical protein